MKMLLRKIHLLFNMMGNNSDLRVTKEEEVVEEEVEDLLEEAIKTLKNTKAEVEEEPEVAEEEEVDTPSIISMAIKIVMPSISRKENKKESNLNQQLEKMSLES